MIEVTGALTIGELELDSSELRQTLDGHTYSIGQVGSMVKIDSGDRFIFGTVTRVRAAENGAKKPRRITSAEPSAPRPIEIELIGEGHKTGDGSGKFTFERGISAYPLPGQPIQVATIEDLRQVYSRPDKPSIKVGSVSQAQGIPVHFMLNDLVGKHFAVLGTTGSGKSCAVTFILQRMIEAYLHAHVVLLDPHNEYPPAFGDLAELVDPTTMDIPHWLLNFEESVELFVGQSDDAPIAETNIVKEALLHARKAVTQLQVDKSKVTVDTPLPYKLGDLIRQITIAKHRVLGAEQEPYDRVLNKIDTLRNDTRFRFLLKDDQSVKDTMVDMLSQYLRVPQRRKPISIIDLSGIPSDVVDVVVSVLCRTIFDAALWNPKRSDIPVFVVCEEAHRYAPKGRESTFIPTKRALARIAKEGRKYGVGLALVTQRPSELDESILSQCNTVIALRMSNEQDQEFVRRTLPDGSLSLVEALPTLRTREAVAVGEGTSIPLRIMFDEIPEEKRPRSADVEFSEAWTTEIRDNEALRITVEHWREQRRAKG